MQKNWKMDEIWVTKYSLGKSPVPQSAKCSFRAKKGAIYGLKWDFLARASLIKLILNSKPVLEMYTPPPKLSYDAKIVYKNYRKIRENKDHKWLALIRVLAR